MYRILMEASDASQRTPRRGHAVAGGVLLLLLLFTPAALAFDLAPRIRQFTLDNGMTVLVLRRPGAPIFAAHMAFKVGGVEEREGATGAAHLLEHMMFKGTDRLGSLDWGKEKPLLEEVNRIGAERDAARRRGAAKAEIDELAAKLDAAEARHKEYVVSEIYSKIYAAAGGVGYNAGTSKDLTSYIIRLPANKLRLWAWVESQRLKHSVFREYYAERDVVMEERRIRYENSPEGALYERYLSAAFIANPYGNPVIGWPSDIATLPLAEVERFWNDWYVPSNAVVALVGDLDFDEVKRIVTEYFADIPSRPLPDRVVTEEPTQGGLRRVELVKDARPSFMMGYHKPVWPHADGPVFSVIDGILAGGPTARFTTRLVREKKVAIDLGVWSAPGERYPNLYTIYGAPRPPHTVDDVAAAVREELSLLAAVPVGDEELARVKSRFEADYVKGMVSHYGMARLLATYQIMTGDWRNVEREMEAIKKVTPADIMAVAQRYFTRENETLALLVEAPR
ncbi:MAG: insulinase family protein [Nitrospinae bacterium]|nr:insulinase family protein [Nitrospinota bacterium]